MATTEGSVRQGKNIFISETYVQSPDATGTLPVAAIPADGAELIKADFLVVSTGTVTTSGTQQWSVSDGTNVMFTLAATSATTAAGTRIAMVLGTVLTNGKLLVTGTEGGALTLTNTEAGTIGNGMEGILRLVWAL